MEIPKSELLAALSQFNPWWKQEKITDLPQWHRAAFTELLLWVKEPPSPRAILLSGARQIGKTTLLLQTIENLLANDVPPANILYATFDHPLLKLAGIEAVLEAWREREPKVEGIEYLFLDEIQGLRDWGTWVKHQVDFAKQRRIVFTGSATPLIYTGQESGVGRWHAIKLTTLSFFEYLQIKKIPLPALPKLKSLQDLFSWPQSQFYRAADAFQNYVGHFHEYLIRGGFPQTALVESITQSQRLLREDIVDKVLKRDMTALFGVRRITELENTFLYLCMHDGGLLEMTDLCNNLDVKRPTAQNFIDLLEAAHLIYRLPPYGYGKAILRARYKIYLADPAISSAVLLRGKSLLEDPTALGVATETAVFKHLFAHYYSQNVRFSYWRDAKDKEVDLLAEAEGQMIPFEVKYRSQYTGERNLKALIELCKEKQLKEAFVITKSLTDIGPSNIYPHIMQIPAPLLCFWMGQAENSQ